MSESFWTIMIIAAVFFVLALAATLKYDTVSHTLKFRDFSIGISGEKEKPDEKPIPPQGTGEEIPETHGRKTDSARVVVGGSLDTSHITTDAKEKATVKVKKNVRGSTIRSTGGRNAEASVGGNVRDSDIDAKTREE